MNDALSIFMNSLMADAGEEAIRINIISDNARKGMTSGTLRRRAPRRSVSTPLHHMSRWETASIFDFESMNPSAGTSPVRGKSQKSRWDSMPAKRVSTGPSRPSRSPSDGIDEQFPEPIMSGAPRNQSKPVYGKFGNDMTVVTSAVLPKSLRSLPY